MKLCFSIDALSPAADQAWRLQQDESWRPIHYAEPLQTHDQRIPTLPEAEAWLGIKMQKDKDVGLIPKGKSGMFDVFMRAIYTHAVIHRLSDAPIPDKQQMLDVIRALPVGTAWLVYLNLAGQFTALKSEEERIIGNLDIAVRGEIASSAAYIGAQAVLQDELMDTTYRQFLQAWSEHLETGKMAVFVPDVEKLDEQETVLHKIHQWCHE